MKASSILLAATLALCATTAAVRAVPILAVDINDRATTSDSPDTAPGFLPWAMTASPSSALQSQVLGAFTVSMIAFDDHVDENTVTAGTQDTVGQIDDRDRTDIPNSGAFTYGQLYDDLVFAGASAGPTGGLDLTITGLSPLTQYLVSFYAFDSGSTAAPQPRTADWRDGNNASALIASASFSGATLPTSNDQYKFTGVAVTDAAGTLLLQGRNTTPNSATGPTNIGVILNGFEINPIPEPTTLAACGLAVLPMLRRRPQTR